MLYKALRVVLGVLLVASASLWAQSREQNRVVDLGPQPISQHRNQRVDATGESGQQRRWLEDVHGSRYPQGHDGAPGKARSAGVHKAETDVFMIQSGGGILQVGGEIVDRKDSPTARPDLDRRRREAHDDGRGRHQHSAERRPQLAPDTRAVGDLFHREGGGEALMIRSILPASHRQASLSLMYSRRVERRRRNERAACDRAEGRAAPSEAPRFEVDPLVAEAAAQSLSAREVSAESAVDDQASYLGPQPRFSER